MIWRTVKGPKGFGGGEDLPGYEEGIPVIHFHSMKVLRVPILGWTL